MGEGERRAQEGEGARPGTGPCQSRWTCLCNRVMLGRLLSLTAPSWLDPACCLTHLCLWAGLIQAMMQTAVRSTVQANADEGKQEASAKERS